MSCGPEVSAGTMHIEGGGSDEDGSQVKRGGGHDDERFTECGDESGREKRMMGGRMGVAVSAARFLNTAGG